MTKAVGYDMNYCSVVLRLMRQLASHGALISASDSMIATRLYVIYAEIMVAVSRSDSPQSCSSLVSASTTPVHETDDLGILQVARVVSVSPYSP